MAADKRTEEELRRLKELIEKANAESALLAAREEMIGLFESDETRWSPVEVVHTAEVSARKILREWGRQSTLSAIEDYCLQQLKSELPIRAIGMGNPQGSLGIGYIMRNVDGKGLYIKLIIAEEGVRKIVKVISFHY